MDCSFILQYLIHIQVAKKAEIDKPPSSIQFDPDKTSAVVDGRLAERARQDSAKTNSGTAAQQFTFHFVDSASARSASPSGSSAVSTKKHSTGPRLSLADFCANFMLSDEIKEKLAAKKITGPHSLRFISDNDFIEKIGLEIGELGDVRDAEQQWLQM